MKDIILLLSASYYILMQNTLMHRVNYLRLSLYVLHFLIIDIGCKKKENYVTCCKTNCLALPYAGWVYIWEMHTWKGWIFFFLKCAELASKCICYKWSKNDSSEMMVAWFLANIISLKAGDLGWSINDLFILDFRTSFISGTWCI